MTKSCPDKCGNVTIPFPFGIGKNCYLDETFGVECNKSSNSTFLSSFSSGVKLSEISLLGYVTVNGVAFPTCYNKSGDGSLANYFVGFHFDNPFSVSLHRNKFVAIGCDIYAYIPGDDDMPTSTGCASFCDDQNKPNLTSAGRGYCETALPQNITSYAVGVGVYSVNTLTRVWTKNPCTAAFIVDKKFSKFDGLFNSISNSNDITYHIPRVYDWVIGNITCREASKSKDYLCKRNTECRDRNAAGGGYNCYCQQGYQGNPYLPDGCQDIDECKDMKNNKCKYNSICINTPGSYKCICPTGHYNSYIAEDGLMRCIPGEGHPFSPRNLLLGVGIATVVLILIALGFWLYRHFERRKKIRIKHKFFKRNGGLLFKHQVSSSEESVMKTKLFAAEELEKATDNFNQSRVLGKGGLGTVYKGILRDGSIVAVKRSNIQQQ